MGGQHRAYQRAIEELAERLGLDAHLARALKGVGERAGTRRRAGDRMGAVAADVMLVFGDVGEMREIAVGAHDRERLVGAEAVERRLELAPRADLVVAMEADRGPADLLDQLEDLFALLLAHGVAEDSAEQADVVAQRHVLVGVVLGGTASRCGSGRRGPSGASVGEGVGSDVALRQYLVQGRKIGSSGAICAFREAAHCRRRASASRAPSAALSLSSHS